MGLRGSRRAGLCRARHGRVGSLQRVGIALGGGVGGRSAAGKAQVRGLARCARPRHRVRVDHVPGRKDARGPARRHGAAGALRLAWRARGRARAAREIPRGRARARSVRRQAAGAAADTFRPAHRPRRSRAHLARDRRPALLTRALRAARRGSRSERCGLRDARVRAALRRLSRRRADQARRNDPAPERRLRRPRRGSACESPCRGHRLRAAAALAGSLAVPNSPPGALDRRRIALASLDTRFVAKDFESALLQDLRVALDPGGTLAGKGALGRGGAELDVQVADLDLRSFRSTLNSTKLSGPLKLSAGAKQTLQGTLSQDDMRISADVVRDGELVEVRSVRAEAKGGAAAGSGRLRLSEPMRFEAKLNLEHFDPAQFGQYPGGDINGTFEGSGTLGTQPAVDARWVVRDSNLEGEPLASQGAARLSGSRAQRVVAQATL